MNKGNSKELKIISDEVVDFINTHQERHNVSDEYKNTMIFLPDGLNLTIDPTYDKTVKISDDDYKLPTQDEKKKKRIKRPGKTFGKNKGARK